MTSGVAARQGTLRTRAADYLRERDRQAKKYDRTRRVRELIDPIHGARDWGHWLMALVGTQRTGSFEPPRASDLYMRYGWARDENRVAIKPTGKDEKAAMAEVFTTRHAMTAWDGVKRGEEWRTFDWQDDGHTLRVGWLGDDGRIHDSAIGYASGELARFRRWFLWDSWVKAQWCGLRPWLYYKGLHAAVHRKYPFTCQATPPRGSGGYDHWYCTAPIGKLGTLRRWAGRPVEHPMPHRYVNYRWDGEGNRVDYDPQAAR